MIVYAEKARYVPERMGLQGKDKIQLNRQWPIPLSCHGNIRIKECQHFEEMANSNKKHGNF